ncbi:SRPBCC family protein [Fodinicola feengrottensis]|uniref:Uncharacterized protein n=1 Tax=Fodinicola feengrottensis TaxID=435914 RepID=A0ABP4V750_9ACTN|nr:hypothetical protein [Fodinicola feengrottensis]
MRALRRPPIRQAKVELSFRVLGPALTRVAVEHRGWEALTDAQAHEECALPDGGGYAGGSHVRGWQQILARSAAALGELVAADPAAQAGLIAPEVVTFVSPKGSPLSQE